MNTSSSDRNNILLPTLQECVPEGAIKPQAYLERYARHFDPIRSKVTSVFELGIHKGGSAMMWRDYFMNAKIAALDIKKVAIPDETGRIRAYRGMQQDIALLDRIAQECAPSGFDIIIDDCSHMGEPTKATFWHMFDRNLKPGGIYVIEDWGSGYWSSWPDGRDFRPEPDRDIKFKGLSGWRREFPSHSIGLPGFIKQLVDECAAGDADPMSLPSGDSDEDEEELEEKNEDEKFEDFDEGPVPEIPQKVYQSSHGKIDHIDIYLGQVFVFKWP